MEKQKKGCTSDRITLIEKKEKQIKEILKSEGITYGMAKTIIQKVEADLLRGGDTFLNQAKLENVSPFSAIFADRPESTV